MNRDDFVYSHVSKFGINDGDWRYLTQSAALKFEMDKKGNVSSIYKGLYVYRDRDSEENILPGETWIVSLTLNPKTESNYFAKGIMRIDARFLFDLEKDQMDEIADAVWNNCRKEIEESFASRFEAEKSKLVEEAVAERTAAYKSQIDEANAKVSSLENKIEEDAQIIDSLKKKQAAPEAAPDAAAAAIPGFESLGRQFPTEIDVMRIGTSIARVAELAEGAREGGLRLRERDADGVRLLGGHLVGESGDGVLLVEQVGHALLGAPAQERELDVGAESDGDVGPALLGEMAFERLLGRGDLSHGRDEGPGVRAVEA